MTQTDSILVIDDDPLFQTYLATLLQQYTLQQAHSGEAALQLVANYTPTIILLDIQMDGMDGYETCKQLRALSHLDNTPILFISTLTNSEDRLRAYGVGAYDYINKPFDNAEVKAKIERLLKLVHERESLQGQIQDNFSLIMDLQRATSDIQNISRFMQSSQYCTTIEELESEFIHLCHDLGISGILHIQNDLYQNTQPINGKISRLEQEIIDISPSLDRIFQFGHGRAVYNWGEAVLLVRQINDKVDTLAIMMDSLHSSLLKLTTELKINEQIHDIERANDHLKGELNDLFHEMNTSLKETFLSIGFIAELSVEEEDRLAQLVDQYYHKITERLDSMNGNNHVLSRLITDLRNPPKGQQFGGKEERADTGLVFF